MPRVFNHILTFLPFTRWKLVVACSRFCFWTLRCTQNIPHRQQPPAPHSSWERWCFQRWHVELLNWDDWGHGETTTMHRLFSKVQTTEHTMPPRRLKKLLSRRLFCVVDERMLVFGPGFLMLILLNVCHALFHFTVILYVPVLILKSKNCWFLIMYRDYFPSLKSYCVTPYNMCSQENKTVPW